MDKSTDNLRVDYAAPPQQLNCRKLRFAIASLALGFAPIVLYLLVMCYAFVRWRSYPVDRMHDRIWSPYHLSAVGVGMQAVGSIFGMVGIIRREQPTAIAMSVFVLNFIGAVFGIATLWS